MAYIEKRKTWIKAIHKCIMEKWNPICMGCVGNVYTKCELCAQDAKSKGVCCASCSFERSDPLACKTTPNNPYGRWCMTKEPQEAEAMLEALVMLLPPEERKIYGD